MKCIHACEGQRQRTVSDKKKDRITVIEKYTLDCSFPIRSEGGDESFVESKKYRGDGMSLTPHPLRHLPLCCI